MNTPTSTLIATLTPSPTATPTRTPTSTTTPLPLTFSGYTFDTASNNAPNNMTIPHVGWKVCTLTRQLRVELFTSYLPLITVNKNPQAQTTTVPVPNAYPPPEPPATVVPLPYP